MLKLIAFDILSVLITSTWKCWRANIQLASSYGICWFLCRSGHWQKNSEEEEILDENKKDQSFTDDRKIEEGLS